MSETSDHDRGAEDSQRATKRKRAAVACNYCRQRKRKCDGKQPMCSLCEEANRHECEYRETRLTAENADLVDEIADICAKLNRLDRSVELLTDALGSAQRQWRPHIPEPPVSSASAGPSPQFSLSLGSPAGLFGGSQAGASVGALPAAATSVQTNPSPRDEPMDIPIVHSTTTGSLLRSGPAKTLLGRFPANMFLHIETRRHVPPPLSLEPRPVDMSHLGDLNFASNEHLIQSFFDHVWPYHPVFPLSYVQEQWSHEKQNLQPNLSSALLLLVLALGEVAADRPNLKDGGCIPGANFLGPALSIIMPLAYTSLGENMLLIRCFYLAALYYSYLARPMQAWRLVHLAGTDIQHYWTRYMDDSHHRIDPEEHDAAIRIAWAIFVLECDIVAEHHLPRSGIERLVEKLSFPACGSSTEPAIFRWLADLSARRLLNRIHHLLYKAIDDRLDSADDGVAPTSANHTFLLRISDELNHQLHAWFQLLPSSTQPNLDEPQPSVGDALILLRYHASGDIIHRPFLLQACSLPANVAPDPLVLSKASHCLYHCRGYLSTIDSTVKASTGSIEIFLHSTLAVTLLLTLASDSPHFSSQVTDITSLQSRAIAVVEKWAFRESSIEAMLSILQSLKAKSLLLA